MADEKMRVVGFAGVVRDKQVVLNPGRRRLQGGETGIVIGTSQQAVDAALGRPFTVASVYSSPESSYCDPNNLEVSANVPLPSPSLTCAIHASHFSNVILKST
jgi:hypothetical protein